MRYFKYFISEVKYNVQPLFILTSFLFKIGKYVSQNNGYVLMSSPGKPLNFT